MTNFSVFDYADYKEFLTTLWGPAGLRSGIRHQVSKAIQCQTSYLSRVLNGDTQFSIEQAMAVSLFLKLSESEQEYFLLLVQFARAGTLELKEYFSKKINEMLEARNLIAKRVAPSAPKLSEKDEAEYYSSWLYGVVHMASLNENLRYIDKLSQWLREPENRIRAAAEFLESVGIVEISGGQILPASKRHLHLEKSSPNLNKHHSNWRSQAVRNLEYKRSEDLHYSVLYSCSQSAFKELQKRMLKAIEENTKAIQESEDETMIAFCLDLFEIK